MAEPFLSEIRIFSFNFPPKFWAFCNGQLLPINQNQALFSLLGTTYGGNGLIFFVLANLELFFLVIVGSGFNLGQVGGEPAHTLSSQEMPAHTHLPVQASSQPGNQVTVSTAVLASPANLSYAPAASLTTLTPSSVASVGGSQAHPNMQPFLTLNFCIALQGIFPSPN